MAGDDSKKPDEKELLRQLYEEPPKKPESGAEEFLRLSREQRARQKDAA
jgi:hypothetical protein